MMNGMRAIRVGNLALIANGSGWLHDHNDMIWWGVYCIGLAAREPSLGRCQADALLWGPFASLVLGLGPLGCHSELWNWCQADAPLGGLFASPHHSEGSWYVCLTLCQADITLDWWVFASSGRALGIVALLVTLCCFPCSITGKPRVDVARVCLLCPDCRAPVLLLLHPSRTWRENQSTKFVRGWVTAPVWRECDCFAVHVSVVLLFVALSAWRECLYRTQCIA